MANISVLDDIFAQKFGTKIQHDHADMPTWPETETEVISHDVISRTFGTNMGGSRWLYEIIWTILIYSYRYRQPSRRNVPN